jgi:large subunit ribosomal protein L19
MKNKVDEFIEQFKKKDILDIRPGDTIRVYQKVSEGPVSSEKKGSGVKTLSSKRERRKLQVFEGIVIARKHRNEIGATITVRKVISGIGVERIFPIHSPNIEKIEIVKRGKARRAKLYYLREAKGKRARLKRREEKEKEE